MEKNRRTLKAIVSRESLEIRTQVLDDAKCYGVVRSLRLLRFGRARVQGRDEQDL